MIRTLLCMLMLLATTASANQGATGLFEKANRLYRQGRYAESAESYEKLISDKQIRYEVYYNLGNAYFKTGQLGQAILNYERARLLAPQDEDISYNLRMAYSKTADKIDPLPLLFYQRMWQNFLSLFSPSTWAIIAISVGWLTALAGAMYLFAGTVTFKRNAFFLAFGLLFMSCLLYYTSWAADNMLTGQKSAVVMSSSAYAKSSPAGQSTNLFMLHEGTRVDILQELNGWKQVRIANGTTGWMESNNLEVI